MDKFLKFLNGKKTWIGALLIGVGYAGRQFKPQWEVVWQKAIDYGTILGTVGVAHKAAKASK